MIENAVMAKKTTNTDKPKKDRHKPSRMVRVRERVAAAVDLFAESKATDFTEAVNALLIRALEAADFWPSTGK